MSCDNTESLGRHIYLTAQNIRNYAEKILSPYALTLEQFHLLKNMSRNDDISQRQLGELVNKTPANITRILDRLESKLLVKRQGRPGDRRCSQVVLTEEGVELVQRVTGILESYSKELTTGISSMEIKITRATLDKIEQNLQNMSQEIQQNKQ